ncbi:MAG: zf-TFIIB domain-containing protein [Armatimonadetes bacterium]|nr:zf-TFIIB domain-containing protein [Armatimonadota bacterium]
MDRHCPRDQATLIDLTVNGFSFESCPVCAGVWIEYLRLGDFVKQPDALEAMETAAEQHAQPAAAPSTAGDDCPNGHGPMVNYDYCEDKDISLDYCTTCSGVWLDDKELLKVEHHIKSPLDNLTAAEKAEYQSAVGEHVATMERLTKWRDALVGFDHKLHMHWADPLVEPEKS